MQLTIASLEEQLAQQTLTACYLLTSTSAFLLQEARDAIYKTALLKGFTERQIWEIKNANHCDALKEQNSGPDLFYRTCIDVRCKGIIDTATGKKLTQLIQEIGRHATFVPLIIISIEGTSTKLERVDWFKNLVSFATFVVITPPSLQQLPYWLNKELKQFQLSMTQEAMSVFAQCVEGNLPAAKQMIQKLSLVYYHDNKPIDLSQLRLVLTDEVAFELFHLTDAILQGNLKRCRRILYHLESKQTSTALVLGYLMRLLRTISSVKEGLAEGYQLADLFEKQGVWQKQRFGFQRIIQSFSKEEIIQLFHFSQHIDRCIKGVVAESSWRYLQQFSLSLAGLKSPFIKLSLQY